MFRFLVLVVVTAALSPRALAQAPDWDRRISDIRIVHPPGTPPGIYRVTVDLELLAGDLAPQPVNLGMDLKLSINGMPFVVEPADAGTTAQVIACFNNPTCMGGCGFWQLGWYISPFNGYCYDPPGPFYGCNCWLPPTPYDFIAPIPLHPTDVVTVSCAARPGSLPEIDTSDDTFTVIAGEQAPGEEYCFGDGSGTACPCAHVGALGNGCPSGSSAVGGNLYASGNPSIANDTLVLTSSLVVPFGPGLYFQGSSSAAPGVVFGNGLRCVGGSTPRLEIRSADALGSSSTTVPIHVLGSAAAGDVRFYQFWYRDSPTYCPLAGFNLTNALRLTWLP